MSAEDNKQAAVDGFAAFGKGDADAAMANMSDSIEWVVSGDSSVSKTYHGKQELGGFWMQLVEKGFTVEPTDFVAEGDAVVVRVTQTIGGGERTDAVNYLTYDGDGQLVRFETFGGEDVLNRAFPK
jgi:ketosteroid isomerase-like protein